MYEDGDETFVIDRSAVSTIAVGSEALLLPVTCSLPPAIVAVFVTEPGADCATATVTVTAG